VVGTEPGVLEPVAADIVLEPGAVVAIPVVAAGVVAGDGVRPPEVRCPRRPTVPSRLWIVRLVVNEEARKSKYVLEFAIQLYSTLPAHEPLSW
jgi:hypothetical protein